MDGGADMADATQARFSLCCAAGGADGQDLLEPEQQSGLGL